VEFLRFHEVPATPVPLVGSAAPGNKTLLDKACELSAGLLVMGACGHSRLHEFLLGSRTHCMLRDSGIPLFLYH
jgi:nucleotide-binding universal stress UspA family protein